jgi:NAD(P)-dependent dehydrogenase (short-subunit alcohol dehydrogenase family)
MASIKGKWALVTGSSRGIGQQIVCELARRGCNVIIHGRKKENTQKTFDMIKEFGVQKIGVEGELATEAGTIMVIDSVSRAVGCPDIIYNNAGIQNEWKEVFDMTVAEWKELFQINLFSIVQINNYFIPLMIKRNSGNVIITTSGIQDIPQMLPYSVSKAGIDKYCSDMVAQLNNTGVLINALDPGWLKTDLGGPEAEHEVETVVPGALAPLLTQGIIPNGASFHAHDERFRKL